MKQDKVLSDREEFFEIVRKDISFNFMALAVTQWNALSIDALIFYLEEKGYKINAAILIAEHFKSGFLIDESFFTNSCSRYYYLPRCDNNKQNKYSRKAPSKISIIKNVFGYYRNVFTLNKVSPSENVLFYSTFFNNTPEAVILQNIGDFGRPVVVCQTEEGIGGTYLGTFFKMYPSFRELRSLKELHGYIRTVFFGRVIFRMLHKSYNSLTFRNTICGLKVNTEILPYYRKSFNLRNEKIQPQVDRVLIESSVIICTSSMKRELVKDDEDLIVFKKVCDELHERGFNLLLKPHPRDNFFPTKLNLLHCELLDVSGLTMESLCEYAKPKAIISFASTVLVNPSIFWNIPTFCISDMLNGEKIDRLYLNELIEFKKVFKNYIHFVKDSKEIDIML